MRTSYPLPKFASTYGFKLVDSSFIHAIHLAQAKDQRYIQNGGWILGVSFQVDQDTIKWYDVKSPYELFYKLTDPKQSPGFTFNNSVKGKPFGATKVNEVVTTPIDSIPKIDPNVHKGALSNTYKEPHKCCGGKCQVAPMYLDYFLDGNLPLPKGKYKVPGGKWTLEFDHEVLPNSNEYKSLQQLYGKSQVTSDKYQYAPWEVPDKKAVYQDAIASKETLKQRTEKLIKESAEYWSPENVKARQKAFEAKKAEMARLKQEEIDDIKASNAKADSVSYGPLLDTCYKESSCIGYLALGFNRAKKNFVVYYSIKGSPHNIMAFFTDDGALFRDWTNSDSLGKFYNTYIKGVQQTFLLRGSDPPLENWKP
jgi:hypothetical protein